VQVSVNVNIGSPPAWGPSGYAETEYYTQMFKRITTLEHRNLFILEDGYDQDTYLDNTETMIYIMDTRWYKRLSR
jgi:hypothetical protein